MNIPEIQKLFTDAVDAFLHFDRELLTGNVHEQAIAHRIANYVERDGVPGYMVDCEYNKQGTDPKRWNGRIFRPDIIVHKRKGNRQGDNLLVVEIKKDKICQSNIQRLKFMTNPHNGAFGYDLGCFLYFENEKPRFIWVEGGRVQDDI